MIWNVSSIGDFFSPYNKFWPVNESSCEVGRLWQVSYMSIYIFIHHGATACYSVAKRATVEFKTRSPEVG